MPLHTAILLAVSLCLLLTASAQSDPIIETCETDGCSRVFSVLAPCGGGATNASLQQDLIYTPTASLGGCECNSFFYNALSSCLSCIASQGNNSPEIQNQQDWVANCATYGFNYTSQPITNSTNTGNGASGHNNSNSTGGSGGLSKGAIAGIVVGALAFAILVGACFFFLCRRRSGKQDKAALYDRPVSGVSGVSGGGAVATAGTTAGTAAAMATAASAAHHHTTDYPTTYDHHDNYYAGYQDPSQQYSDQAYGQQQQHQQQQHYYPSMDQNGYYGTEQNNDAMMMQNLNNDGGYIPPPPHPSSAAPLSAAAIATGAVAGATAAEPASPYMPRPSDSVPQSLRNKHKGWGSRHQHELPSSLITTDHTLHNDKTEFDDGEELEPPRSRNRYGSSDDYSSHRSITPTRANMQSYRDEFKRPSFEREPRRSGSDRGSVSGLDLARGVDTNANGVGYADYEQQGDFSRSVDSPESARRRARAAELFSAESSRR
ncbi:hypothetical protein BGZ98_000205 [Dissophora globulifera]|nr:hypothetical protein BGZ98_000205 [Dissophora globulifera]